MASTGAAVGFPTDDNGRRSGFEPGEWIKQEQIGMSDLTPDGRSLLLT
jgi:hypothetical protein